MEEFNIDDYVSLGKATLSPMFKPLPPGVSVNCQNHTIVIRKSPTGIRVASRQCRVPGKLTCMMCRCGPEPELPGVPEGELDEESEFTLPKEWRDDLRF